MEPVKGGALAKLPDEAEKLLKAELPDTSVASWAFRFLAGIDNDVLAVLSGMSTQAQMADNIKTFGEIAALTAGQSAALERAIRIFRDSGPVPVETQEKYRGLTYRGLSATALLELYNHSMIQPNPTFTAEENYLCNTAAEELHQAVTTDPSDETVMLPDGTDGTAPLREADEFLRKNHF